MGLVYCAKNKKTKLMYIGYTTTTIYKRRSQHYYKAFTRKVSSKFYDALRDYNKDSFEWTIIENDIDKDSIQEREKFWIEKYDSFDNGYNSSMGGESFPDLSGCANPMFGKTHTKEVKKILSKKGKRKLEEKVGLERSIEIKNKFSENRTGKKDSEKTLEKKSKAMLKRYSENPEMNKGSNNGRYIKVSLETLELIFSLYNQKASFKEISEKTGLKRDKIKRELKKKGIYKKFKNINVSGEKNPKYIPLSKKELESLYLLYKEGYSMPYISNKLNIGVNKVRAVLLNSGIKIRNSSEQSKMNSLLKIKRSKERN